MPAPSAAFAAALEGRYRIERELGAGGMATVYLAYDVRHDRRVALKVLRPELSAILGAERFLAEIKTTANLQHPHILGLFDSGEADGLVFYVMPFVEGESLRDRLAREKQLPVEDAVGIAREVADALHYAHEHGVVHRDIKPENILLHGGHAMVADFGIALAASRSDGSSRMTETGMSLGTPHYMSPEQAMGDREITPKADIYALGCVLYEMLTAEPPFMGATAQAIIARVMTEEPRSLTLQRHTIPRHVEAAVRTALEKLPADRFTTAREFRDALGNAAYSLATETPSVEVARGSRSWGAVALIATPWVLLAATLAVVATRWPQPAPPQVTRQRIALRTGAFGIGLLPRRLAISPDGRTMVFRDTSGGQVQLWAKESHQIEATPLAGTTGASTPTFSPDGEWIAFYSEGRVKKVPRRGGPPVTVAEPVAQAAWFAVAWLDNDTIVFNTPNYQLAAVHENGGPVRQLPRPESIGARNITNMTPLPGGRGVLATTCSYGCAIVELRSVDLATGQDRILAEESLRGWYTSDGQVVFVRRDGGVFSADFDLDSLAFRSAPQPLLEGVRTTAGGADMVLGQDGTLFYVSGASSVGGERQEAIWISRDGVEQPFEPQWTFNAGGGGVLALAPDGRRLALSIQSGGGSDIWIKESGGPLTRLTFGGVYSRPSWSPDGRWVRYVSSATGRNEDIMARRADGTGTEETVLDQTRTLWELVDTPDSTRFIVRLGVPPSRDIHLWKRGDTLTTPLLATEAFQEVAPSLSPDGRWLAYVSDETGRRELYVRPFPAVDTGRWQISRNGAIGPRWSHTGRELFFVDKDFEFMSVGVTTSGPTSGATLLSAEPKRLFSAKTFFFEENLRFWALAPDNRRFLFARPVGDASAPLTSNEIIMVTNWLTELKSTTRRP